MAPSKKILMEKLAEAQAKLAAAEREVLHCQTVVATIKKKIRKVVDREISHQLDAQLPKQLALEESMCQIHMSTLSDSHY